jgi:hypothetical protein
MSDPSAALQDPPADDDPAVLRAERRLAVLQELTEIGMRLARALDPGAASPGAAPVDGKGRNPADAFAPLSRAIRLTVALEAKTDQELRDLKAGVVRERTQENEHAAERARLAARKPGHPRVERVRDLVLGLAHAELPDRESLDRLFHVLDGLLEDDDIRDDCIEQPLRDNVESLCEILGLHPDWSRWEGEGWAAGYIQLQPRWHPPCAVSDPPSSKPLPSDDPPQSLQNGHDLE